MWAELHRRDDGRSVLVNPDGVLLVWEDGDGETTVVLTTGDRIPVRERYASVSGAVQSATTARRETAA